jgi:hypothetical protein
MSILSRIGATSSTFSFCCLIAPVIPGGDAESQSDSGITGESGIELQMGGERWRFLVALLLAVQHSLRVKTTPKRGSVWHSHGVHENASCKQIIEPTHQRAQHAWIGLCIDDAEVHHQEFHSPGRPANSIIPSTSLNQKSSGRSVEADVHFILPRLQVRFNLHVLQVFFLLLLAAFRCSFRSSNDERRLLRLSALLPIL